MAEEAKLRTALLVRCTAEEAKAIREAARKERRTISGFVLNSVMNRIAAQKQLEQQSKGRAALTGHQTLGQAAGTSKAGM